MGTPNFAYKNRCIVVSNEDLECGNYPELEDKNVGGRSYPSYIIPTDFNFFDVIFTYGYYEAACIDYQEKDDREWEQLLGYSYGSCPTTKAEFFNDISYWFKVSKYRLRELCKDIKRANFKEDWEYTDALCEVVGEYLAEQEEAEVNKYLDEMIEAYGFEEYYCVARASNGEAFYRRVNKAVAV